MPFLSIVLAFFAVLVSGYLSYRTIEKQETLQRSINEKDKILKYYETGFSSKQTNYSAFLKYLDELDENSDKKDVVAFQATLLKAKLAYEYELQPFLRGIQEDPWQKFIKEGLDCDNAKSCSLDIDRLEKFHAGFVTNREEIKSSLLNYLFK
jgi:hypothetical protein